MEVRERSDVHVLCLRLLTALLAVALPACTPAQTLPNILVILADDLGFGALGANGRVEVGTPHMDRLAAEGARFTRHHAGQQRCAGARRAAHRTSPGANGLPSARIRIPAEVTTLPELLREDGPETSAGELTRELCPVGQT